MKAQFVTANDPPAEIPPWLHSMDQRRDIRRHDSARPTHDWVRSFQKLSRLRPVTDRGWFSRHDDLICERTDRRRVNGL
jgi:hypothetical protein